MALTGIYSVGVLSHILIKVCKESQSPSSHSDIEIPPCLKIFYSMNIRFKMAVTGGVGHFFFALDLLQAMSTLNYQ